MIQRKLSKVMLVCSILFSLVSMSVMLYFSATKTIVIAEEVSDRTESERLSGRAREDALQFEAGSGGEGLRIPLPPELRADDIVIENRYIEHCIYIILKGKYREFYRSNVLTGEDPRIEGGYLSQEDGMTRLQLMLGGPYEHQYMFENGVLQLSFHEPWQLYDKIVVIDAAHGGSDDGATGNGILEKEIVLAIAEKVREKLEDSEIRVYCTRTDDTTLTEEERAEFVHELRADMLISIRAAADESSDGVYGIRTVYNGTYFIPYFGNVELADLLERHVVSIAGSRANGLMETNPEDRLLWNVQVPAAAIEVGYVTNKEEASFLSAEEYQEKLADGIINALVEAYERKEQN